MPRLVISGFGEHRRSMIAFDAPISSYKDYPEFQGLRVSDIWKATSLPTSLDVPVAANTHTVAPNIDAGLTGFNVRYIMFPPRSEYELHTTPTIDFIIITSGQIVAVMEDGEVVLKEGDIFIQRSTPHGWRNQKEQPCSMVLFITGAT
ncbi:cupin domain-containing protein [Phyllobacterium salinisoli]|nr:cupin domain-containing protein [Phyllobacterium salinisoli]